MRKALRTEHGPVEIHGAFIANGVQHPAEVLQRWSAEELAEIGVEDIHEPAVPYGYRILARHLDVVADIVVEVLDLEPVPLAELQAEQQQLVRAKRWAVEVAGTPIGPVTIATDEKGQGKIAGAVQLFANDPTLTVIDWEAQPGVWISIDQAAAINAGVVVGRHVQACFTRARALSDAIAAAETAEDLSAIDIEGGWPATAA